jgi:Cu+-exporting ATPase
MFNKKTFYVQGMDCAACAINIERKLSKVAGVIKANVNYATEKATIEFDNDVALEKLQKAAKSVGHYNLIDESTERAKSPMNIPGHDHTALLKVQQIKILKNKMIFGIIFSALAMVLGYYMLIPGLNMLPEQTVFILLLLLATPVQIWLGSQFYKSAWAALKVFNANMDTLIVVGTSAAYVFSLVATLFPQFFTNAGQKAAVYFDTSIVILTLIVLGRYLEAKAKSKASEAIKRLIKLQAKTARVIINDQEKEIAIEDVKKGDLIMVKPGEKIPVDGEIIEGETAIDESMITGESIPVDKKAGDKVIGATINKAGSFVFKAEKIGQETALAQIIKLVEDAQATKAPIQHLADTVAGYFVPIVLVIALLSFVTWLLIGQSLAFSLIISVTVLIIACPCALGLATPTAILVATGKGAEEGILIKDAESLEKMKALNVLAFDKTGTLTEGKPQVVNFSNEATLKIAYALEKKSEHPLAMAVVKKAEEYKFVPAKVEKFKAQIGHGVEGQINGKDYYLGNMELLKTKGIDLDFEAKKQIAAEEDKARTVLLLADTQNFLGFISIADVIKEDAIKAIAKLHSLGIEPILMTGDNPKTAEVVANLLNIAKWHAKVKPDDKLKLIRDLQAQGNKVGMVGDGINDAPALTQANVGIAMGTGTDVAIESADIVILKCDITKVVKAIKLSKKTMTTIKGNLFWAFIYNIIGIPVAAGILYPFSGLLLSPMIAAGAMAFSSIFVVLNSLRLGKVKL